MADPPIARRMNAAGHRTRNGRPYDRRAIQNVLTNPFYAGRIAYKRGTADEQIVDGRHPPLVDPARFDRIQRMRAARDYAEPDQKRIGRPVKNHALARLAVCGRCGERLYPVTSHYRRKDGTRARSYQRHSYKFATGTCDAKPIDAELVDAAVENELPKLLLDYDAWRKQLKEGYDAERARLGSEVARAERDRDAQAHKTAAVERKWGEYVATGEDHKADLVLPMVERERQSLLEAERRLKAANDAMDSTPCEAPTDAMLDFQNAFREAVSKRMSEAGTLAEVNRALRELFSAFAIHETEYEWWPTDDEGHPLTDRAVPTKDVIVRPFLKPCVAEALDPTVLEAWRRRGAGWRPKIITSREAPPVQTLSAQNARPFGPDGNVQNSHKSWHYEAR